MAPTVKTTLGKKYKFKKKNAISPFGDARGKKSIGATITIGREIRCLPYAEFFILYIITDSFVFISYIIIFFMMYTVLPA